MICGYAGDEMLAEIGRSRNVSDSTNSRPAP